MLKKDQERDESKPGFAVWEPKDKSSTVEIIPYSTDKDNVDDKKPWEIHTIQHFKKGERINMGICPASLGGKCPICVERQARLIK